MKSFGSNYTTPGWQRAQGRRGAGGFSENGQPRYVPDGVFDDDADAIRRTATPQARITSPRAPLHLPLRGRSAAAGGREGGVLPRSARTVPLTIEGELIAKSTGAASAFEIGARVFHQKFGNGNVVAVDGNKLTIRFDKAGEKRVVDSFVERV